MRARMTMSNLLSQQNGPMSQEVSQFQDDHLHQMEDLGRQLRQQQDNLLQLQRERAAKYVMNLSNSNIPMTNANYLPKPLNISSNSPCLDSLEASLNAQFFPLSNFILSLHS